MKEVITFIYYYGHYILLLLVLSKVLNILVHSRSALQVFKNYFTLYNTSEIKDGIISGSRYKIFHNVNSYTLQAAFIVWLVTVLLMKFLTMLYLIQHS